MAGPFLPAEDGGGRGEGTKERRNARLTQYPKHQYGSLLRNPKNGGMEG
jgi:hypothetical protein